MYSVVMFQKCRTIKIVPYKNCEVHKGYKKADFTARGVYAHEVTRIYYSPRREEPDFSLPIRSATFDETEKASYNGFVLRSFGTYK